MWRGIDAGKNRLALPQLAGEVLAAQPVGRRIHGEEDVGGHWFRVSLARPQPAQHDNRIGAWLGLLNRQRVQPLAQEARLGPRLAIQPELAGAVDLEAILTADWNAERAEPRRGGLDASLLGEVGRPGEAGRAVITLLHQRAWRRSELGLQSLQRADLRPRRRDAEIERLAARSINPSLSIALVTYAPDLAVLTSVLEHLSEALRYAEQCGLLTEARLTLVDNGPGPGWREPLQNLLDAAQLPVTVELLSGQGNVGYGAGHNLALWHSGSSDFHLILNPDVLLEEDALSEGLAFLAAHPDAGLVAPAAWDGQGRRQYLCKRYPTVLDLALRGFAPASLRRRFQARMDRYELRDRTGDEVLWDPPIASGCFMLCRRAALERVGGFRPEYFLYFEDFDLSLRLAAVTRLVQVPAVRVVHLGGNAARKGTRHIGLFLRAAAMFFNRHGWQWW